MTLIRPHRGHVKVKTVIATSSACKRAAVTYKSQQPAARADGTRAGCGIEHMFGTVAGSMGDAERRYAELHCHTNFSFLDGASHPEEVVEEAARLGLAGLAVTDHDGLYGAVRFALAASEFDLPTVFGAELTLGITRPANGEPDPEGEHLVVLAEGPVGYARLARAISEAQLAGEKGAPRITVDALARAACAPVHLHPQPSERNDSWYVLTGCRKGTVPAALVR